MAFGDAGESYLEVLDALFDAPEIRLVTCRQEGGAAFMAEAYAKLTGKPATVFAMRQALAFLPSSVFQSFTAVVDSAPSET